MPPPPPTFSMVTGWPSNSESDGARIRPRRSAPPPAAHGTTMVSGRLGHSCASAMPGTLTMSAAAPDCAALCELHRPGDVLAKRFEYLGDDALGVETRLGIHGVG